MTARRAHAERAVPLSRIAARLLLAWLMTSVLFWWGGTALLRAQLPMFGGVVERLHPGMRCELAIDANAAGGDIRLTARTVRPIAVALGRMLPKDAILEATTSVAHTLVPQLLLCCALLAWPVHGWRARAALVLAAAPLSLLLSLVCAPLVLAGHLEMSLLEQAARFGAAPPTSPALHVMLFLESGGRWLLPLVLAALVADPLARRLNREAPARPGTLAHDV